MVPVIYALCAVTSMMCSYLLLRSYRFKPYRLLLWSGLCFAGLSVNNLLLILDRIVFPGSETDFSMWRLASTLATLLLLLYGLIWEEE